MPGMHFMRGFATDEFYSTPDNALFDGTADFSVGIMAMIAEDAGDNEAILSCYRPTAAIDGWEIRTGGDWSAAATQTVQFVFGENTGPTEVEVDWTEPAAPNSLIYRPFFYVVTIDVSDGGTISPYLNGLLDTTDTNAGGIEPGQDAICLGHGYDNAGAAARGGDSWLVHGFFLHTAILTEANVADMYRAWCNGIDLHAVIPATAHVWYAQDARNDGQTGGVLPTWYSRVPSTGTPLAMTADVDDGLVVEYRNVNLSF